MQARETPKQSSENVLEKIELQNAKGVRGAFGSGSVGEQTRSNLRRQQR